MRKRQIMRMKINLTQAIVIVKLKKKKEGGIFGKMKTIEEALAEKEAKKKEKQKKKWMK